MPLPNYMTIHHPDTKIIETEISGRGLYTTKDLTPGSLVLSEPPLTHTLKYQHAKNYCDVCLTPTKKICKGCNKFCYCCVACQKLAWKNYHKIECKLLKKENLNFTKMVEGLQITDKDLNLLDWIIFLGRIIIRYNDDTDPNYKSSVDNLCSNYQDLSAEGQEHCFRVSQVFMRYFGEKNFKTFCNNFTAKTMLNLISRLKCNMFVTTNEDMSILDKCLALYPNVANLNHSCLPNTHLVFYDNGQLSLKLNGHVKSGEEICISYCDVRQPAYHRKKALKSAYSFDCDCQKCNLDRTNKNNNSHISGEFTVTENIGISFREKFDEGDFSEAENCAKFLDRRLLDTSNNITISLCEYVFDYYLKKARQEELKLENEPPSGTESINHSSQEDEGFDPLESRIIEIDEEAEAKKLEAQQILKLENEPDTLYKKALIYGLQAVKGGNENDFTNLMHGITTFKVSKLLCYMKNFENSKIFLKNCIDILEEGYDEKFGSRVLKDVGLLRREIEAFGE